jgi:oxygen-independent coproporphyrinogen-3 oxidase
VKAGFQSLYLHVPFCRAKCGYCTFFSVADAGADLRQAYLARLEAEFAEFAERTLPLQSVFIGGGTPSILTEAELTTLLQAVRRHFTLASGAEWSVECNPDSLDGGKVRLLAEAGVNRVCLGIQSFHPAHRQTLCRHGELRRLDALVAALRSAGFRNLGADLIYGIPGQSVVDWEEDLRRALDLGFQHLSTYELTLEEGSRLWRLGIRPGAESLSLEMWEAADELARGAGLERYEVSNFARPGFACRHNLEVWHGATYLGCGPAASSFDGALRWTNPASLEAWLQPHIRRDEDPLAPGARAAELLAFGLRTTAGWTRHLFRERTGVDYDELRGDTLAALAGDGLLERGADWVRPSPRGLLFADTIAGRLL